MDFISSISFSNEPLISWTFLEHFCHHFWVGLLLLLDPPKSDEKMFKKFSTDQRFIRKRNTTYKIHTLAYLAYPFQSVKSVDFVCSLMWWKKNVSSLSCLWVRSRILLTFWKWEGFTWIFSLYFYGGIYKYDP